MVEMTRSFLQCGKYTTSIPVLTFTSSDTVVSTSYIVLTVFTERMFRLQK